MSKTIHRKTPPLLTELQSYKILHRARPKRRAFSFLNFVAAVEEVLTAKHPKLERLKMKMTKTKSVALVAAVSAALAGLGGCATTAQIKAQQAAAISKARAAMPVIDAVDVGKGTLLVPTKKVHYLPKHTRQHYSKSFDAKTAYDPVNHMIAATSELQLPGSYAAGLKLVVAMCKPGGAWKGKWKKVEAARFSQAALQLRNQDSPDGIRVTNGMAQAAAENKQNKTWVANTRVMLDNDVMRLSSVPAPARCATATALWARWAYNRLVQPNATAEKDAAKWRWAYERNRKAFVAALASTGYNTAIVPVGKKILHDYRHAPTPKFADNIRNCGGFAKGMRAWIGKTQVWYQDPTALDAATGSSTATKGVGGTDDGNYGYCMSDVDPKYRSALSNSGDELHELQVAYKMLRKATQASSGAAMDLLTYLNLRYSTDTPQELNTAVSHVLPYLVLQDELGEIGDDRSVTGKQIWNEFLRLRKVLSAVKWKTFRWDGTGPKTRMAAVEVDGEIYVAANQVGGWSWLKNFTAYEYGPVLKVFDPESGFTHTYSVMPRIKLPDGKIL